jgi:hypothetical protein
VVDGKAMQMLGLSGTSGFLWPAITIAGSKVSRFSTTRARCSRVGVTVNHFRIGERKRDLASERALPEVVCGRRGAGRGGLARGRLESSQSFKIVGGRDRDHKVAGIDLWGS